MTAFLEGLGVALLVAFAAWGILQWQNRREAHRQRLLVESWHIMKASQEIHSRTLNAMHQMLSEARLKQQPKK